MFDLKNPRQDAEFGAAPQRWNFDASEIGYGQQGMCASWK
jgi:hypothetical protein